MDKTQALKGISKSIIAVDAKINFLVKPLVTKALGNYRNELQKIRNLFQDSRLETTIGFLAALVAHFGGKQLNSGNTGSTRNKAYLSSKELLTKVCAKYVQVSQFLRPIFDAIETARREGANERELAGVALEAHGKSWLLQQILGKPN